jgi:DNA-binding CsgD family transcriptional regulator
MIIQTAVIYAGTLLLGFGTIGLAYGLQRRFRVRFVADYFVYLLAAVIYGFLNWIGPYLIVRIFDSVENRPFFLSVLIFGALGIPFLIVKIYFLFSLIIRWMGLRLRLLFKLGIGIFSLIISVMYALDVHRFLVRSEISPGRGYIFIIGTATVAVQIIILLTPLAEVLIRPGRKRIQGLNTFCILSLIGFGIYVYAAYTGEPNWTPLIYFIVLLIPLLYVWFFLQRHSAEGHGEGSGVRGDLARPLGFTPRELEIVDLVLLGRNNRQIGRQLFLSLQSVKNALTRIYRKAGVRSRSQLMSLLMRKDGEG